MPAWVYALIAFVLLVGIYVFFALGEFGICFNTLRHSETYLNLDPTVGDIVWECFKLHIIPFGFLF